MPEHVVVDEIRQEADSVILTVGVHITSLRAVDRDSGEHRDISFVFENGSVRIALETLAEELPHRMSRFDLFAKTKDSTPGEREEVRLRVASVQSIPVWQRYFRSLQPSRATVPHIYINRGGSLSAVVRNPSYLDHGERQFRHRQELTRLRMRGRAIHAQFALTLHEEGPFSISRFFLKHQSNEALNEIVAVRSSHKWRGRNLEGSFTVAIAEDADPHPLRHALYVELLSADGREIQVRLDHLSEELFNDLNRRILPPRILLNRRRVLAMATSPRTTLASFLVRPASIADTQTVRQHCFIVIARAEAVARRILRRPRKPTALIFEKEAATAQDNGIALFDSLSRTSEAVPFSARFLMDRNSPQWRRVAIRRGVIAKFSLAHWRVIMSPTTFLASSETRYHAAHLYAQPSLLDRHAYVRKNYFLQHGVTGFTRVTIFDPTLAIFPDFAVATAAWEREVLVQRGMPPANIDVTGFARWDRLVPADQRQASRILYMPTWRDWLEGRSADELLDSEYVQRISSLLQSPELHRLLERHGARLAFLPHPKFKDLAPALADVAPHIEVLDQDRIDFATVINETDIAITDYSSIAWEFVRGSKTALLYRFDHRAYRSKLNQSPPHVLREIVEKLPSAEDETTLLAILERTLTEEPAHLLHKNESLAQEAFEFVDAHNTRRIREALTRRLPELCTPRTFPNYRDSDSAYRHYLNETLALGDDSALAGTDPRE